MPKTKKPTKHNLQKKLEKIAEYTDCFFERDDRCRVSNYSGRFMFNEYCLGFVAPSRQAVIDILEDVFDRSTYSIRYVKEYLAKARTDNWGTGIVFYWPSIPFFGEEENEKYVAETEPPSVKECQTDIPTGIGPFSLGTGPKFKRCGKNPAYILVEKAPDEDGLRGGMSVCADCYNVFKKEKSPPQVFEFELNEVTRALLSVFGWELCLVTKRLC